MTLAIILIFISYLMGSICSAVIVCRIFNLPDPREEGSMNPGATNVLRIAGKQYAALVLFVDLLKGTIPVVIAKSIGVSPTVAAITVLAAVLGHMYPIFFNFKGGKGVATAIGALLGLHFIIGVMVVATWLLVVSFSRYSSLASIIAIALSPLYTLFVTHEISIFPPLLIMAVLVLFKHGKNISRLIDGSEPKVFIKENVIKEIMMNTQSIEEPLVHKESQVEQPPVKLKTNSAKKRVASSDAATKPKRKKADEPVKEKKKTVKSTEKDKPKAKPKAVKEKKI